MTTQTQSATELASPSRVIIRRPAFTGLSAIERARHPWNALRELLTGVAQSPPSIDCTPRMLVGPNASVVWSTGRGANGIRD